MTNWASGSVLRRLEGERRGLRLVLLALGLGTIVLVAAVNFTFLILALVYGRHVPIDWDAYAEAYRRFGDENLYSWSGEYYFRYAPIAAPLLGFWTTFGIGAWRAAQIAVTLMLPSRWLTLLVLISYPFFFDVNTGNLMIFILVAGVWTVRGNSVATAAFLLLTALVPRPLMLPLAAWVLWKRPQWRLPALLLVLFVVITTVMTGYATAWPAALLAASGDITNPFNFGPTAFVGLGWMIVGVPLAIWFTYRGHLGWASIVISPYLLPYYYLMLGLEIQDAGRSPGGRIGTGPQPGSTVP